MTPWLSVIVSAGADCWIQEYVQLNLQTLAVKIVFDKISHQCILEPLTKKKLNQKTESLNLKSVTRKLSHFTSNKCSVWPHPSLPVVQKLAANLSYDIAVSLHPLMTSQTCLLIVQVLQVFKQNIWKLKICWDRQRIFDSQQTLVFSLVVAVTVRVITVVAQRYNSLMPPLFFIAGKPISVVAQW